MRETFTLGYRRLEWKCNALNEPSRRAAQRLGFRYEGTFRQATVVKGRNRDTAWFSIIDGEWPGLQSAFECWLAPENFDADGRQRAPLTARPAAVAYAEADADQWLMTASADGPGIHLAIVLDDEAVRGIGIVAGDGPERHIGRFGYWLGQCVWGRGLATAAARAFTGHAAIHQRFARLEAEVLAWNPASMRVLEKAGFFREGVRKKGILKDGQLVDTVIYGLVPLHSVGLMESR